MNIFRLYPPIVALGCAGLMLALDRLVPMPQLIPEPFNLAGVAIATLAGLFVLSFDTMRRKQNIAAGQMEERFGNLGDKMAQASAQGASRVASNFDEMNDKLAQVAAQSSQNSYSWGANLVIQFARGMANAIVAVVSSGDIPAVGSSSISNSGSFPKAMAISSIR